MPEIGDVANCSAVVDLLEMWEDLTNLIVFRDGEDRSCLAITFTFYSLDLINRALSACESASPLEEISAVAHFIT